jgi:phenylacetate-CoA ligase
MFVSTEGLVGHSEPGGLPLTFASDLCLAECADENGQPVPDGVSSARVLVTNLHNLTQPLIRYDLTDRFTPAGPSPQGFLRATVDGRADDFFRYGQVIVHPSVLITALLVAPEVQEYQVRQTAAGADIAVIARAGLDPEALTREVERELARAGLPGAVVTIRLAGELPRDARTGKTKRFVALDGRAG